MNRLCTIVTTVALFAGALSGGMLLIPAFPAYAAGPNLGVVADAKGDACAGIGLTGGSCSGAGAGNQVNGILATVINLFSVAVGVAAVIMIIIGGMKYITSGGDTSKTAGAKTTIIYALVGLALVASAQAIVHFVLGKT